LIPIGYENVVIFRFEKSRGSVSTDRMVKTRAYFIEFAFVSATKPPDVHIL